MNDTPGQVYPGADPAINSPPNKIVKKEICMVTNNIRKAFDEKLINLNKKEYLEGVDIINLQEVNIWKSQENYYTKSINGYIGYFNTLEKPKPCPHSHLALGEEEKLAHKNCINPYPRNGVATFIREELANNFKIKKAATDNEGRTLILNLKNKEDNFTIVNVYAPAENKSKREEYFRKLRNLIKNHTKKGTIIMVGGDMNSVWRRKDTNANKENLDYSIREFGETCGLIDVYVEKIGKKEYTWTAPNGSTKKRLDSFYMREEDLNRVGGIEIIKEKIVPSDHKAIKMTITLKKELEERDREKTPRTLSIRDKTKFLNKEDWKRYRKIVGRKITEKGKELIESLRGKIGVRERDTISEVVENLNKIIIEGVEETHKYARDKRKDELPTKDEKKSKENQTMTATEEFMKRDKNQKQIKEGGETSADPKQGRKGGTGPINKRYATKKIRQLTLAKQSIQKTQRMLKKSRVNPLKRRKARGRIRRLRAYKKDLGERNLNREEELATTEEEIKEILKSVKSALTKKKRKFKHLALSKYKTEMREAGWANKSDFYNRALKEISKRKKIAKVPDRLVQEKEARGEKINPYDPEEVKKMIKEYWEKLFKKRREINDNKFKWKQNKWYKHTNPSKFENFNIASSKIMEEVTPKEFKDTLKDCKANVAGGIDEILNEHIKRGPECLKDLVRKIINRVLETQVTPRGWKESRIFMIHKKKDKNDPYNYRGITLCPTVHKLLTKILAKRLTRIAEKEGILSKAQGVTKPGQSAFNHHRVLGDIIEDANQFGKKTFLTYVDLKKAYDYVEHWAMREALTSLNFDKNFVRMIDELNALTTADVITEYGNTERFDIERGLRQGCPLSPILFCIFIEPFIRWVESEKGMGYTFHNNKELRITILAYMDDIVLIAKSKTEMDNLIKMLEEFLTHYGMEIGDKSAYTHTENITNEEEKTPPTIQGYKIQYLGPNEPYKYLGFLTNMNLTWTENFAETKRKMNSAINLIKRGPYDPRLKLKCIRLVPEKIAEYAFHAAHHNKTYLKTLEVLLKKAAKSIMRVTIQTPSVSLWKSTRAGGLQIANATDLYRKTLVTDLLNTLNFTNKENINYKTTTQRLRDYTNKYKITLSEAIKYPCKKKFWVARALEAAKELQIKIENIKDPAGPQKIPIPSTTINYLIGIRGIRGAGLTPWSKLTWNKGNRDLLEIISNNNLKTYNQVMAEIHPPNFYPPHWEEIRKQLCEGQSTHITEDIKTFIEHNKLESEYEKTRRGGRAPYRGISDIDTYSDGSRKDGTAGSGVWCRDIPTITRKFRTFGKQEIYNAEMQGALEAIAETPPRTINHIHIDNISVLRLCSQVETWTSKQWRKAKALREARLILEAIREGRERGADFRWYKVKSHVGVEGNEEADVLANEGRETRTTYINYRDFHRVESDYRITRGQDQWENDYRKNIGKTQEVTMEEKARKEEENNRVRKASSVDNDHTVSNWYLKCPSTTIAHTVNTFKARQDVLPHAKEAMRRKMGGYTSTLCALCSAGDEDTAHILVECRAYEKERKNLEEEIYKELQKHIPRLNLEEIKEAIPAWFVTQPPRLGADLELSDFNKLAGMLGIIPPTLKRKIREVISTKGRRNTCRKRKIGIAAEKITKLLHLILIKNITTMWKARNKKWERLNKTVNEEGDIDVNENDRLNKKGEKPTDIGRSETSTTNHTPSTPSTPTHNTQTPTTIPPPSSPQHLNNNVEGTQQNSTQKKKGRKRKDTEEHQQSKNTKRRKEISTRKRKLNEDRSSTPNIIANNTAGRIDLRPASPPAHTSPTPKRCRRSENTSVT